MHLLISSHCLFSMSPGKKKTSKLTERKSKSEVTEGKHWAEIGYAVNYMGQRIQKWTK